MQIYKNARIATMDADDFGIVVGDLAVQDGKVVGIGDIAYSDAQVIDCQGNLITPSLVDCHTHLVFGGNRASEWEARLNGVSYQHIAKAGGGINTSVQATRTQSFDALLATAHERLQPMLTHDGVGLIEIKSGYGLDLDSERKMLKVAHALGQSGVVSVARTLLAAHAVPPEFDNADDYMRHILQVILPTLHEEGAFDAVDIFCENIAFNLVQTQALFEAASALDIPIKGHTEQLSNMGGSALVARFGGLSCDHIEYLDEQGVRAMAQSGTVAVLLPMAFTFLKETQKPPIELLRKLGVPMAVATDFNPGTAPFSSLRLAMNMACVQFGLTPLEAWQGVTVRGAQALGRNDFGKICVGMPAHFNIWHATEPVQIIYEPNAKLLQARYLHGKLMA